MGCSRGPRGRRVKPPQVPGQPGRDRAAANRRSRRVRREITSKVIEIQADEAKNLRTLAQTYTSTTPRATVAIFREMDDVTVVKILSLMKSESVAPIFEEMTRTAATDPALAKRAAVLSEKLRVVRSPHSGGRNALFQPGRPRPHPGTPRTAGRSLPTGDGTPT